MLSCPSRAYEWFICVMGGERGEVSPDSEGWKLGAAGAGSKIKADTRQSGVTAVCIPIDLKA